MWIASLINRGLVSVVVLITTLFLLLAITQARADLPGAIRSGTGVGFTAPSLKHEFRGIEDFKHRLLILLSGRPWLVNDAMIDEMVGDPWMLERSTQAKLLTLPPRLRMELFTFLAEHLQHLEIASPPPGGESLGENPIPVVLNDKASEEMVSNLASAFGNHFSTSEVVDLGVFILSRLSFFPEKNDLKAWNRWKRNIVRYDIWLGLAVAALYAANDNLTLRMSGKIVNVGDGKFALGWYGGVEDLGFKWTPTFDYGLRLSSRYVSLGIGGIEHLNAEKDSKEDAEVRSFQAMVTSQWLEHLGSVAGWEVELTAGAKYIQSHGDPTKEGDFYGLIDAYVRKGSIGGNRLYSMMLKTSYETNFDDHHAAKLALGFEDEGRGYQLSVQGSFTKESSEAEAEGMIGAYLGGTFGPSQAERLSSLLGALGERLLRIEALAIKNQQTQQQLVNEISLAHFGLPGAIDTPKGAGGSEIAEKLRVAIAWEVTLQKQGADLVNQYQEAQAGYFECCRVSDGDQPDLMGPLDEAAISRVLKVLAHLP